MNSSVDNKVKMILFTAPSGAGKTTIVNHLLNNFSFLGFSVSATTRNRRVGETEGKHYYFIEKTDFENKIANGDFIEWEEVYAGQYYGTLRSEIDRLWTEGKYCVFDIDVKGASNLKAAYGDACLAVFIKAPTVEELERRLRLRDTESPESLEKRVKRAIEEMIFEDKFDMVLINDNLEYAKKGAESIIVSFFDH